MSPAVMHFSGEANLNANLGCFPELPIQEAQLFLGGGAERCAVGKREHWVKLWSSFLFFLFPQLGVWAN